MLSRWQRWDSCSPSHSYAMSLSLSLFNSHPSSYFHVTVLPLLSFLLFAPVLSCTSLSFFHLAPFLSFLMLPLIFLLKGLLSDNYVSTLSCLQQARAHDNHTFVSLCLSTATVWKCECWTLLSCPLSQGINFWFYVPFHQELANLVQLVICIFIFTGFTAYCCIWWTCHKQ